MMPSHVGNGQHPASIGLADDLWIAAVDGKPYTSLAQMIESKTTRSYQIALYLPSPAGAHHLPLLKANP